MQGLTTEQSSSHPVGVESREEMGSVPLDFYKSLKTFLLSGKNGVQDWEAHAVKAACHQKKQGDRGSFNPGASLEYCI